MITLNPGEEIREIEEFPNYWVTSHGRIVSGPNRGCSEFSERAQSANRGGYNRVTFYRDGRRVSQITHLLVARAFIPNPLNLPTVNHIRGEEKWNNRVDNLEWATHLEQVDHALRTGLFNLSEDWGIYEQRDSFRRKPYRLQMTVSGVISKHYETRDEARAVRDRICAEHMISRPIGG
jgi:hypothetical protein